MDPFDDIFDDVAVKKARPAGKFQPKAKIKLPKKNLAVGYVPSSIAVRASDTAPSELTEPQKNAELPSDNSFVASDRILSTIDSNAVTGGFIPPDSISVNILNPENIGFGLDIVVEDSTHANDDSELPTYPELLEEGNPGTAAGSRSGSGISMKYKECEREETDVMDSTVLSELTTAPARSSGKYKPKPKIKTSKGHHVASTKSVSNPPNARDTNSTEKNFLHGDVLNVSSVGSTDCAPIEETSELPVTEESMNPIETTQLDPGSNLEGVPENPAKLVSRRAKKGKHAAHIASDLPLPQKIACTSGQENEIGRVLRPRKRKVSFGELDEAENVPGINELPDEVPYSPAVEDNDHDDQIQLENEPKANKSNRKKSGKSDGEKEKPAKKQKKAKEVSAQVADLKPKKFSHSTKRRHSRQVDPSLVNMDPELIDMGTVCLRDVIRLGEHWDQQTKKDVAASKPAVKPSNGDSSALYNEEDEPFTYREGEEENDDQENPVIEESSILVNYHTYMDRTPTVRWSKQDTELFYKGVSQFGADLSMIQQLFPSRTRHQIKLKYKKEERQQPLRLRDALTNRTKDLSHYEVLIERLKKMADQEEEEEEERNAENDESVDLTGEEVAEGTSQADDEAAALNEQVHEEECKEDVAAHDVVQETADPIEEPYDSEDDMLQWSQYKSDI